MPRGFSAEDYADGIITRSSVSKETDGWWGYAKIQELYSRLAALGTLYQNAFAALFLTGGRISEVLELDRSYFSWIKSKAGKEHFLVKGMMLEKKKQPVKDGEIVLHENPNDPKWKHREIDGRLEWYRPRYKLQGISAKRNPFEFRSDEPMAQELKQWIISQSGYVFPSPVKFGCSLSRVALYNTVSSLGTFPHNIRSQRASCLVVEYGFDEGDLMRWMSWDSWETAHYYVKLNHAQQGKMLDIDIDFKSL